MKMIRGSTLEEQMKSVDMILQSFKRRLQKVVVGVIPPVVVPFYSAEVGTGDIVVRYMAPISGVVYGGGMFIGEMKEKRVEINISVLSGRDQTTTTLEAKVGFNVLKRDLQLKAGDRIVISILGDAKDVWTSIVFEPRVESSKLKRVMLDELLALEEEDASTEVQ